MGSLFGTSSGRPRPHTFRVSQLVRSLRPYTSQGSLVGTLPGQPWSMQFVLLMHMFLFPCQISYTALLLTSPIPFYSIHYIQNTWLPRSESPQVMSVYIGVPSHLSGCHASYPFCLTFTRCCEFWFMPLCMLILRIRLP